MSSLKKECRNYYWNGVKVCVLVVNRWLEFFDLFNHFGVRRRRAKKLDEQR
jgi:hypothetical protein